MSFYDETRYEGSRIRKLISDRSARYLERYERVAANVFEWEGLPEPLTSDFMEQKLVTNNLVMFKSEEQGFVLARAEITGWDVMNRPRRIRPSYFNPSEIYTDYSAPSMMIGQDCAYIQDTKDCSKHRIDYIKHGAICDMMADIDIAIKQQIINQRAPLMFTSDGSAGSMKGKIFTRAYLDGGNVFVGSGGLGSKLEALSVDSPFNVKDLEMLRGEYYNEGLQLLGVDNMPAIQKRERMNDMEVSSNEELLNVYLEDALGAREEACEVINDVFNLDVTVRAIKGRSGEVEEKNVEDEDDEIGEF